MTRQIQDAYICAAVRTPVGKAPRGMFKTTRPDDLLAHCLKGVLMQTPQLDKSQIGDVIIGCAMPEAEQGMNVARISLLLADYPNSIPGMTINRFCSSGLQAVSLAADKIMMGEADLMIAGGTESMSLIPMMGNRVVINPKIFENEHIAIAYGMGITAEKVAAQWNISRERQDEFSLKSHQKACAAIKNNEFKDEILPYHNCSQDEGPRSDTSMEALSKLSPVFAAKGSVTAGNSSQMSDGSAAILLASEKAIKEFQLKPLARFVGFSVAGVPAEIMGIGPIKAIPKILKHTNIKLEDIDWIELNEAFAAQSLAVMQELGLNQERVNPLGGAISSGHPLGATGAIRTAMLVHGLKRHNKKYGMVTMCVGTGMGAAGIFEAV